VIEKIWLMIPKFLPSNEFWIIVLSCDSLDGWTEWIVVLCHPCCSSLTQGPEKRTDLGFVICYQSRVKQLSKRAVSIVLFEDNFLKRRDVEEITTVYINMTQHNWTSQDDQENSSPELFMDLVKLPHIAQITVWIQTY